VSKGRHIGKNRTLHPTAEEIRMAEHRTRLAEPTERQMTTVAVARIELETDLEDRLNRVRAAYSRYLEWCYLGEAANVQSPRTAAAGVAEDLLLAPDDTAHLAARNVIQDLISPPEAETITFWGSPLGRVMAARGAYPTPVMPRDIAGVILGVTKQRVSQMVADRLLEVGAGTSGVTAASVLRLLVVAER